MSIAEFEESSPENVEALRSQLGEMELQISASPRSPRNIRLRQLIDANRGYDLFEAFEILGQITDALPPPRRDVAAVIIWAGTQLTDSSIAALHAAYSHLGADIRHGPTLALSKAVYDTVILVDADEQENEILKNMMGGRDAVHQALDQEAIHFSSAREAAGILGELAAQVRVFCPAGRFFIRPDLLQIPPEWLTYNPDPANDQPLINPGITPGMRTILLTIGHGQSTGGTHFPSLGIQTQDKIAKRLRLDNLDGILYLPLQCYPQAAVRAWRAFGGVSESIHNEERSDDIELNHWIASSLYDAVKTWIG